MKSRIIPTIFSHNKREFDSKLKKLVGVSNKLQVDFMDGIFVPSKSIEPKFIPNLSIYNNIFEAHLMVQNPREYFDKIKDKGFKKIIFHLESFENQNDALVFFKELKRKKLSPALAINPSTKISDFIISNFDSFLIMGVNPGKEKQQLKISAINKIKKIKSINSSAIVQVDGGVNLKTASKLFKAGANYLNSGSFISENEDPKKALLSLEKEV